MDAEIAALSSAAATTLVTLMTTDSWGRVKAGFARLWRRAGPGRAEAVEADLDAARETALTARRDGDEEAASELRAEWQSRLRRVAASDVAIRSELARLVEELRPDVASAGQAGTVVMVARASGGSRINQAGRDQTVTGG